MKSCFLFIFALFNAFLCIAQQSVVYGSIPNLGASSYAFTCIPTEFSFNGKPMITFNNNNDIDVYDSEFKLVATLKSNEIIGEKYLSQVTYTRDLLGVTLEKDTIIQILKRKLLKNLKNIKIFFILQRTRLYFLLVLMVNHV